MIQLPVTLPKENKTKKQKKKNQAFIRCTKLCCQASSGTLCNVQFIQCYHETGTFTNKISLRGGSREETAETVSFSSVCFRRERKACRQTGKQASYAHACVEPPPKTRVCLSFVLQGLHGLGKMSVKQEDKKYLSIYLTNGTFRKQNIRSLQRSLWKY